MKHLVQPQTRTEDTAEFTHTVSLFREALHQASARRKAAAPPREKLEAYASRARKRRMSTLLFAWTLGPALTAVLCLSIVLRPPAPAHTSPAGAYAADTALLDQVNDELSQTAPASLEPLARLSTPATHGNTSISK